MFKVPLLWIFLRLLILFYESPKTGLHSYKVKKHKFSNFFNLILPKWFVNDSHAAVQRNSLSKPLLSVNPHLTHVSEAERCEIFLFVCVRSAQSLTAKANAPLMFRSRSPVNRIPLRSRAHIKCLQ